MGLSTLTQCQAEPVCPRRAEGGLDRLRAVVREPQPIAEAALAHGRQDDALEPESARARRKARIPVPEAAPFKASQLRLHPLLRDKGPQQRLELSAAQVDEAPARHVQEGQVLHPAFYLVHTAGSETCSLPVGKYLSIVRLRSGKCLIA